jgi:hypothetical protein
MESPTSYVPLWQSLVGSLGAFAVAAFTVAITNRHSRVREEDKDRRSRHVGRVNDLKDRLDACFDIIATAFRSSAGSARSLISVASQDIEARTPTQQETPLKDNFALMSDAITRAELHFPTLVEPFKELATALLVLDEIAAEGTAKASFDRGNWKSFELAPFLARFQVELTPAVDRRQDAVNEARRLLVHDFDLVP